MELPRHLAASELCAFARVADGAFEPRPLDLRPQGLMFRCRPGGNKSLTQPHRKDTLYLDNAGRFAPRFLSSS